MLHGIDSPVPARDLMRRRRRYFIGELLPSRPSTVQVAAASRAPTAHLEPSGHSIPLSRAAALGVFEVAPTVDTVEEAFPQHPDSEIVLSFPGLGIRLAARVLDEIGDDRTRFADVRGLRAYAGASPVTRASGKKSSITRRWVKNHRLNHAGYLWAFSAITASPGAKAHNRRRRDDHGDWHAAGQHNLFNRRLGRLHHCLKYRRMFDEHTAFPAPQAPASAVA